LHIPICLQNAKKQTAFNIDFEKISQEISRFNSVFIVILDLNNLKYINDTFGHLTGIML
jgi:GGDEF domain-containing protein